MSHSNTYYGGEWPCIRAPLYEVEDQADIVSQPPEQQHMSLGAGCPAIYVRASTPVPVSIGRSEWKHTSDVLPSARYRRLPWHICRPNLYTRVRH